MKKVRPKYILRLDDACHQMPIEKWEIFEDYFDRKGIKPIIGVVPLNKDVSLGSTNLNNFWDKVKNWETKGWIIAMHGLHHLFEPILPKNSFFNFGDKSEFVGKTLENQTEIIRKSIECFEENNIEPSMFMAPSHTFNKNTLKALELASEIKMITDGFSFRPFKKNNFIFIPQQLWSVRKMPFGLYTICIHPTPMNFDQIHKFIDELDQISDQIISPSSIDLESVKNQGYLDLIFEKIYLFIANYKFQDK